MKLYKIQLTDDKSRIIYVGTATPSLIGTNYPNAVKIEAVDDLTILS